MAFSKLLVPALALISLLSPLRTAAAPVEKRASGGRTSTPSGCLTVRGSGTKTGEYATIASALSALGSGTSSQCIFIYSGTYAEQLSIKYGGPLTLYGYTTDIGTYKDNTVTITHTISSPDAGSLDASSTANIVTDDFNAYNLNFVNGYGTGAQAVAVTANGDRQGYYACQFYGYQDTLYAKAGYQYYSNCYIEGAVDYIFGDASAWFGECTIASNSGGAITANSREETTDTSWYVIDSSTIEKSSGTSLSVVTTSSSLESDVYLGRPWRVLARVIYQRSSLSDIINPKGWTTLAAGATPIFEEYDNTGDGASTSSRVNETATSTMVSKSQLWPTGYSWIDTSY